MRPFLRIAAKENILVFLGKFRRKKRGSKNKTRKFFREGKKTKAKFFAGSFESLAKKQEGRPRRLHLCYND